jgi:hypothetical protein
VGTTYSIEKETKAKENKISGRLTCTILKEKVVVLLAKGATPAEGKWINTDLNVMIRWYKRDGDKSIRQNKE